ncbi:hypothetical protein MSG28_014627 [Choristoneura fumiferana]|uniref:Uncharacterized protein n=2 Tax=Choristoneura fumiferana TaxID=7141 RepID=A0ACC0JSR0_CHOFU|nr:hypothetical protein MSG28_014627 [Choristoneura fumiferana]
MSKSTKDLNSFLKALDAVNESLSCVECMEFCKNPVTLSKCFHIICSEHFSGLNQCPKCEASLEDCTTWSDDKLSDAVDAAKNLSKMFEPLQEKNVHGSDVGSVDTMIAGLRKSKRDSNTATRHSEKEENSDSKLKVTKPSQNKTLNTSLISAASNISKSSKTFEKRNRKGETMLHIACRLGKLDKVTKMLHEGANVNTKDNAGWTPLHEVVQNGRLDLVKLLLQHNALVNVPGQDNETPLHESLRFNHIDITKELVNHGADINARNCKGETPLELASAELKSVLQNVADKRTVTEESFDLSFIERQMEEDNEEIRVFCTSQYRTVHNKLKTLSKHHINIHIELKFSNKVTHLIVDAEDGVCVSSLDVLQGIVNNLWIITSEWVTKSTEENLELFKEYEICGVGATTYNGPKRARYNRYKQLPGIFDGCHFYLHNFNTKYKISDKIEVTKAILSKLISDAGGIVLRRVPNPESIPDFEKLVPYHAQKGGKLVKCSHYIIYKDMYEPLYNMQHLKALPIGWLIECIEKYELCEPW